MQLDETTSAGFIRRWYLLNGQARCPFNAVDPSALTEGQKARITAQNNAVRLVIATVETYEAAVILTARDEPEEFETVTDDEGEPVQRETLAHAQWALAKAVVAGASPATIALAQRRTGFNPASGETDPFTGKPLPPEPYPADPDPVDDIGSALTELAPDGPTLSDWRVALTIWGRLDTVVARIKALADAQSVLGQIASERMEYSNNVYRAQLMALRDAFGFSADDVEESLWRAERVRQGDLSGVWPLPEQEATGVDG